MNSNGTMAVINTHLVDKDENPAGGCSYGDGFTISWQSGTKGINYETINGAFVEDVIEAVVSRLMFYQRSKYACERNREAISHMLQALALLEQRTADRKARGVEGTNRI